MSETSKLIDNWWVFPGFEIEVVATGLELPVNLAFVPQPDKRPGSPLFYVTELYGQVKAITNDWQVHTYADRLLNYEPDHRFPGTGESGLIGICVEPRSGDLFLSMIYEEEGATKGKVVRTSGKDRLRMDSLGYRHRWHSLGESRPSDPGGDHWIGRKTLCERRRWHD